MVPSRDLFDRPLRSLRLSVTDRCNLRCGYCMPEESYTWLPKREILSFEEAAALVDGLVPLGVDRVRLPGGEPLVTLLPADASETDVVALRLVRYPRVRAR